MGQKKKYYHFTFSVWTWIELAIAIAGIVVGGLDGINWVKAIALFLAVGGVLVLFIHPMIINRKEINNAYPNGLLDKAISESIEAAHITKDREWNKKKYEHYLREITQADRLNPIDLNIDDTKFDNLFSLKGALSITNAPIFAWKDPEYNWFLIANYMATLIKRQQIPQTTLEITDRNNTAFEDFIHEGDTLLEKLSDASFQYDANVRFYIISKTDIKENKAMIEQMIAGHELFGIHLFIIDPSIFDCVVIINNETKKLYDLYQTLVSSKKITDNSNVLDIMIYKNEKDEIKVKYPSEGELKERYYKEISSDCNKFTQELAKKITGNSAYRIYPIDNIYTKIDIDGIQIDLNSNYTFCKI